MNKTKVVISIDTEFLNSNIISGQCLQLGFVVIKYDATDENLKNDSWLYETLSLCFKPQKDKFEDEKCATWWKNYPDIMEKIIGEAEDIEIQMKKLQNWLNNMYQKYYIVGFLADHSSVDMPWFRNLFLEHTNQEDTKFVVPWSCICTANMTNTLILMGYNKNDIKKICSSEKYKHTHYAVDDAIECGYYYLKLKSFIQKEVVKKDHNMKFLIFFSLIFGIFIGKHL